MDLHGFNAAEVEPTVSYEPMPAGWYKAVITASEERPTKAQTGSFLMLTLEVIEGPHQGRKLIDRLNLNNPNTVAKQIAEGTLSSICRSLNIMKPSTSYDLHDKPLMIKVKVKPANGEYGPSNEIANYAPIDKAPAPATAVSGGAATPPWKRGKA
jgi:hypothetical protein